MTCRHISPPPIYINKSYNSLILYQQIYHCTICTTVIYIQHKFHYSTLENFFCILHTSLNSIFICTHNKAHFVKEDLFHKHRNVKHIYHILFLFKLQWLFCIEYICTPAILPNKLDNNLFLDHCLVLYTLCILF